MKVEQTTTGLGSVVGGVDRSNANQINPFERGNPYKFRHESNTALAPGDVSPWRKRKSHVSLR